MPKEFAAAEAYRRCMLTSARTFESSGLCQTRNPYYCGRRFGERADPGRLSACRQLLTSNDTAAAAANYTVPPIVRARLSEYRACLSTIRTTVPPHSHSYKMQNRIVRFVNFRQFLTFRKFLNVIFVTISIKCHLK